MMTTWRDSGSPSSRAGDPTRQWAEQVRRLDRDTPAAAMHAAARLEGLEPRVLLSGDPVGGPARVDAPPLADIQKLMVAGDPSGSPSDSPAARVDANTIGSDYAGVGSLWVDAAGPGGFLGSATAISPTHVLTAAHMLDHDDNGSIDVAPADVAFVLNYGGDLSHVIAASALTVHPDWTGFGNPSTNDDVAVIELSSALPAGVPIYALNTDIPSST